MNGLPADLDLTFLVGRKLEQVCFSLHQVRLMFDRGVWIDIEGDWALNGTRTAANPGVLGALLEQSIADAKREGEGDLVLMIGSHRLEIFDSHGNYESYTIGSEGSQIVV
jgi:hypothetical protein